MTSGPPQSQSQSLSPPSLSDRLDGDFTSDSKHAQLIDAAAAMAVAELNHRNATANASIDFTFPSVTDLDLANFARPESLSSSNSTKPIPNTQHAVTLSPTSTPPPSKTATTTATTPTPTHLGNQTQFWSHTIAPSPPPLTSAEISSSHKPAGLKTDLPHSSQHQHSQSPGHTPSPQSASLRLRTDIHPATPTSPIPNPEILNVPTTRNRPASLTLHHKTSASSLRPVPRTPSFKHGALANAFGPASAASSTVSSPIITAMGDVTPLPSPLLSGDSPGPWKRLARPPSREAPTRPTVSPDSVLVTASGESIAAAVVNQSKRRSYATLAGQTDGAGSSHGSAQSSVSMHTRNRSTSEYIPDPMLIPKRMVTVSGSRVKADAPGGDNNPLRREPHLSEARGLTPLEKPPTPPPSESSLSNTDSTSSSSRRSDKFEYFEARGRHDWKRRRWRAVKLLGQGTFSRVMLATSQMPAGEEEEDSAMSGLPTPDPRPKYDRRTLVAVKVCEHGPRGGASEDRVEISLKRELEIMQSIHHPSLVHLKAWSIEPSRAILVLSYCPGGDLFDVASAHRDLLSPGLLRRMFAELIGAVSYLHERRIVHRDIKLENVLVNLTPNELSAPNTDWATYPYSVITLTDLGLSRRIADDERLETRCGSDDYAAPEVIMGQAYDGRATDAWSLGVLLYALLEGRLPFDPLPGTDQATQLRMRSRTSHRIARVEWRWVEYGVQDPSDEGEGDHEADPARFEAKNLSGARDVVEGLLKRARSRWPLSKVAQTAWVAGGIQVEGGIRFRDEEEGEEVS